MGHWKCLKCNSDAVEALDWVDMNSGEQMGDRLDEFYCRSCEAHTEVVYEETSISDDFKQLFKKEELDENA